MRSIEPGISRFRVRAARAPERRRPSVAEFLTLALHASWASAHDSSQAHRNDAFRAVALLNRCPATSISALLLECKISNTCFGGGAWVKWPIPWVARSLDTPRNGPWVSGMRACGTAVWAPSQQLSQCVETVSEMVRDWRRPVDPRPASEASIVDRGKSNDGQRQGRQV
jgi:hypothetical protein